MFSIINSSQVSPYRILIALDSFKGSMTSIQACLALQRGLQDSFDRVNYPLVSTIMPISDGGDGLLEALLMQGFVNDIESYTLQDVSVFGPYGQKVKAKYLLRENEAILEMAQSTGLTLTPIENRRTFYASSYGLGEMILDAYTKGARKIILGVGGSATNDGGAGCLQALGIKFHDKNGAVIKDHISPKDLHNIYSISGSIDLCDLEIEIICDVENSLLGKNGATYVYGKQKGILDGDLEILESNLSYFADIVEAHTGKILRTINKSGAGGGVVFGLSSFCCVRILNGAYRILDLIKADEKIRNVDIVITGEGCLDRQSSFGKAPIGIASRAFALGKHTIGVAGLLGEGYLDLREYHIDCMFSIINAPMPLQEAIQRGEELLYEFGVQLGFMLVLQATKLQE
ncbi:glycerate kinase [Helicobacter muridarum]|uniref:Glycerate kinase n=1 Tax=Helicobacter muridarum TaxID=216 RepID=A0A377PW31_9HELI|nr:glycerate kinase [Helicobacter muridarum]TLE00914.1 glycerate kinase [Helicobacter muridarum]STQ86689.1 Glycerate kinase [Helicobacter muridarum]